MKHYNVFQLSDRIYDDLDEARMGRMLPLEADTLDKIYHNNRSSRNEETIQNATVGLWSRGYFEKVAEVVADGLEGVFHKCQNLENSWLENPHVAFVFIKRSRGAYSLSVGDIVEDIETGKRYIVFSFGFLEAV